MTLRLKKRPLIIFGSLFYTLFLAYFYYIYVPLVKTYQLALVPFVSVVFLLTLIKIEWGTLSLLFLVPLVGNLPYYFGLYEDIPQAPVPLILFLFYLLAFWLRRAWILSSNRHRKKSPVNSPKITLIAPSPEDEPISSTPHPLQPILGLYIAIILISMAVTFLRYSNFFPFVAEGMYELKVNVNEVRAGGARMSTVFGGLNLATGPLFSLLLWPYLQKERFRSLALKGLVFSFSLSLVFGLIQIWVAPEGGQLPSWRRIDQFHFTYKDPNSLGFFIAALLPLLLGLLVAAKKKTKLYLFLMIISLPSLALSGSRSAFLAFSLGFILTGILLGGDKSLPRKKKIKLLETILGVILLLVVLFFSASFFPLSRRLHLSMNLLKERLIFQLFSDKIVLWSIAWEMFRRFPLSGVGVGSYIVELPNFLWQRGKETLVTDSAENFLFQAMAELGFVGLLLLLALALKLTLFFSRHSFRPNHNQPEFLKAALSGSLIACLVNFSFHSYIGGFACKYLFWFLLTLFLGLFSPMVNGARKLTEIEVEEKPEIDSDMGIKEKRLGSAAKRSLLGRKENKEILIFNDDRNQSKGEEREGGEGNETELNKHIFPAKKTDVEKASLIILALIFLASNLVVSLSTLSIPHRTKAFGLTQDFGFFSWEKDNRGFDFRWTRKRAGFSIEKLGPRIVLPLVASHPDIEKKPVVLTIYLADAWFKKKKIISVGELKDKGWKEIEIDLSNLTKEKRSAEINRVHEKATPENTEPKTFSSVAPARKANILLEVNRDWNPEKAFGVKDSRNLGVGVGKIWYRYPAPFAEEKIQITNTFPDSLWKGPRGSILETNGVAEMEILFQHGESYLRLWAQGQKAMGLGPMADIFLDNQLIGRALIDSENWIPLYLPFPQNISPGRHSLKVAFLNDFFRTDLNQNRNLFLGQVEAIRLK
ncbi:MAG: O-antigen ligase family protein [Candidatus Aminicenantales bacterium]